MKRVKSHTFNTIEVNRSKFIAHIVPIDEFENLYKDLKNKHPKANHIVYAMRYFNEYGQIVENSSDDGEPKGCAGVPALNVLRGEDIVESAVAIVRYFGGIKLGTGGMARAYSKAVKELLEVSELLPYIKEFSYEFSSSYSNIDKILYQLKELKISSYERDFGIESVEWRIKATKEQIERLSHILKV